jgi:hypothetical protein
MELNLGPAVKSEQVEVPEDGIIGCRNMYEEVRNK